MIIYAASNLKTRKPMPVDAHGERVVIWGQSPISDVLRTFGTAVVHDA